MHGGSRDKWQRLLTNLPTLKSLEARCDGGHSHLPWGAQMAGSNFLGFATAEEAEYPQVFCEKVAKALMEHVAGPPVMAGLYLAREFHEAGLSVTVAARLAATLGEVGLTHPSDLKGLLVPDDAGEVYAVKNAAPDRPSPDRRDTKQEFISPTDLAFAAVPHTDYTPRHLG